MFLKYKKKIQTILLYKDSPLLSIEDKVNIILSPEYYWVKKVSLPIKYVREVKPLLPSLFEGSIPDGQYSYSAYKDGDDFYIFAYEDKSILDVIHAKGLKTAQVQNIYFAQSEFSALEQPVSIDASQSMCLEEGIVVLLPSLWIEEGSDLNISTLTLSKHKNSLKQFGHLVDNKSLYGIIGIFLFFILAATSELYMTMQKIETQVLQREKLFQDKTLKSTMMQNRAILTELKKVHENQTSFRRAIGSVLSLKLQGNEKLSLITLKNKKLLIEFVNIKRVREIQILGILKKKGLVFTSSLKSEVLKVEVKL